MRKANWSTDDACLILWVEFEIYLDSFAFETNKMLCKTQFVETELEKLTLFNNSISQVK